MRKIPENAFDEAKQLREIALALVSGDVNRILDSGYLDRSDYISLDGDEYSDIEYQVTNDYTNCLHQDSSLLMSAYDFDKYNKEIGTDFSFADYDNYDKSYISFKIGNTENLKGELAIANDGEYFIILTDKDNNALKIEKGVDDIDPERELWKIADTLANRHEEVDFADLKPDRTFEEAAFYYKTADINNFHSEEDYNEFKLDQLRDISGADLSRTSHHRTARHLIESLDETSHLIIEHDAYEKSFIMEVDGNIFYHDHSGTGIDRKNEFKFVERGEDFTFKGAEANADVDILQSLRMVVYQNGHDFTEYHVEREEPEVEIEPEPEPEVKKTRTLKPGR